MAEENTTAVVDTKVEEEEEVEHFTFNADI